MKRKKCGCGFAAPCVRLVCGLCSSPIYRRLFFDCSSFSKRNTIEEQTKNKQRTIQSAERARQSVGWGLERPGKKEARKKRKREAGKKKKKTFFAKSSAVSEKKRIFALCKINK
ncbi:MAG: hypothetical protein J6X88_00630 [Bacteroidales bacterium]|nr:hypothetical protein [Bacteroidales bacterium]